MTNRQKQMTEAQRLAGLFELACEDGFTALADWFEGSHIGTKGDENGELEKAVAICGDCPWTEFVYNAKNREAYVYIGRYGQARVPQRVVYNLHEFFTTLHDC